MMHATFTILNSKFLRYMFLCAFGVAAALSVNAQTKPLTEFEKSRYNWSSQPWNIRYIIATDNDYESVVEVAKMGNKRTEKSGSPEYRQFAEYFPVMRPFAAYKFPHVGKDFGYQVIEFDRAGRVVTPHTTEKPLVGKERLLTSEPYYEGNVLMVEGDGSPGNNWYLVAKWFHGTPSDGDENSPALCDWYNSADGGRYHLDSQDNRKIYDPIEVGYDMGLVGCREWAWQRNRPVNVLGQRGHAPKNGQCESGDAPAKFRGRLVCPGVDAESNLESNAKGFVQPYIDITTSMRQLSKQIPADHQFLRTTMGWASFDDPVRPVIGNYSGHWICLHECPDGEKPGLIKDIKAWVNKRGWPLPKTVPFFGPKEKGTPSAMSDEDFDD